MSTAASIGHGSAFARGDGASPEVFTNVGEINSISGPGLSKETIDATDMDSPERWREFITGLKDGGEVSIECNFDPDGDDVTDWLADINEDAARNYKIVFPDTTEWGFSGIMTGLEVDDPMDDKMSATATYKLSGKPTFIGS